MWRLTDSGGPCSSAVPFVRAAEGFPMLALDKSSVRTLWASLSISCFQSVVAGASSICGSLPSRSGRGLGGGERTALWADVASGCHVYSSSGSDVFSRCTYAVGNHDFIEAYKCQTVIVQYPLPRVLLRLMVWIHWTSYSNLQLKKNHNLLDS